MENARFSIVVPVYKIEESRLRDCLNSIKAQNNDDIEIIVVDDGSPDRCGEICDEIAGNDPRFTVIHCPNNGVSHARNIGIQEAKSDLLIFVDGDDQLLPGMIDFIKILPEQDLFLFDYCINGHSKKSTDKEIKFSKNEELAIIQSSFIGGPNIYGLSYTGAPWGKVYRKSIIVKNDCYFDEKLPRSQDNEFNFRYMNYVKECTYIEREVYNYTVNSNSAMRKFWEKAFDNSSVLLETIMTELDIAIDPNISKKAFWDFAFTKLRDVIDTNIYHFDNTLSQSERRVLLSDVCDSMYFKECIKEKRIKSFSYDGMLLCTLKMHQYYCAALLIKIRKLIKRQRKTDSFLKHIEEKINELL